LGYAVGRWIGPRVLARYGRKVGLTEERLSMAVEFRS
jgi:membrane protein DedA with SNARE-associated domain